jgi:DNA-binding GntR family transcriptional regulator
MSDQHERVERAVLATLGHEGVPLTLAEIARWSNVSVGQARSALMRLRAAGRIALNDNGYWAEENPQ